MKAVVVIPTYNEAGSIGEMLDYLCTKTFPAIRSKKGGLSGDWEMEVLVVDDSSPDGTGKIVRDKSAIYPEIHLLERTAKTGIGSAYLDGFRYAMEKLHADYVFEMDGDFQHPPETILPALKALEEGYDYVIGSRKIKGGSNPKGWGFTRLFFSEVGGFVARLIMFFPFKHFFDVTDPTTGFKVTKVKGFLDHLNLEGSHLYSRSFGYKLQLLYETLVLGAKFKEVPLAFQARIAGKSKIETQTAKEILFVVIRLRWFDPRIQRFMKFGIVGFVGYLVNASTLYLFTKYNLPGWFAWGGSTELAIISNFTWNNIWTFKDLKITGFSRLAYKFLQFNFTSAGALIIQVVVGLLADRIIGTQYRQIVLPLTILFLILPYNYLMYTLVIWKTKKARAGGPSRQ
jgi:dolichol-phosphate mannosyltransferase